MRILVLGHAPSVHTALWTRALQRRGHEVLLLSAHAPAGAGRGADGSAVLGPVPTRLVGTSFPIRALRYASARGAVQAEARRFRPDVTVAHFLPNYGFLAALAGLRPWMLVAWGSDLLVNATRSPFHRARARWTLRRADLVHVDAALLAEAAVELGAPEARVWTRAWGVDVDALAPEEPWSARRARSAELRILWTRQLEPLYDPETFVRALGKLRAKDVPFRATAAGSGPLRSALERLARREGVEDRIQFVGWIDRERLTSLYRAHDAYVSLSRSDSTSQSLLEALAAGMVPVVTDIPGNLEWVRHRREGLLVPVGDPDAVACALAEVARGGAHLDEIAARGAAQALARARFTDTVSETEERLRALAGGVAATRAPAGSGSAR